MEWIHGEGSFNSARAAFTQGWLIFRGLQYLPLSFPAMHITCLSTKCTICDGIISALKNVRMALGEKL